MPRKRIDFYLLAILISVIVFSTYWISVGAYKYNNFQSQYFDTGEFPYSAYLHLYYPQYVPSFQFLVFANHISLFSFLILPIFAIFDSPITLLVLQDIALSLAAIVVYLIGKNVVNNKLFGFIIAMAFLVSPGINGLTFYDFHLEAFIPLFYLLTFYLYMRNRMGLFVICFAMMLSIMESLPAFGLAFLIGLMFYETVYNRNTKNKKMNPEYARKMRYIFYCVLVTIAFFLFYQFVANGLASMYGNSAFSYIPQSLKYVNVVSVQLHSNSTNILAPHSQFILYQNDIFAFLIIFLGFGITLFADPLLIIILTVPWLAELLIFNNEFLGSPLDQYYAYVIGAAVVATVLGKIIISRKQSYMKVIYEKIPYKLGNLNIIQTAIGIFVSLPILFVIILLTQANIIQQGNNINSTVYKSMTSTLASIPQSANVMAQTSLFTHIYDIPHLELTPSGYNFVETSTTNGFAELNISYYWFKPEYIVIDPNLKDFYEINSTNTSGFNIYEYMGNNYTLINSTYGLEIYKIR